MDVELGRRNLAGKLDGLGNVVLSRLDGALYLCLVIASLFADVELTVQEADDANLDVDVGDGALLNGWDGGAWRCGER